MQDCIFCKIIAGQIPCKKVWEDENFLAILDINPAVEGMTVLLSKEHYPSYIVESMDDGYYQKMFLTAKKVAKLLDKALGVKRTAIVLEGLGINHAHIKLYPIHGLKDEFQEIWANERVSFKEYPGYITTQLGPKASEEELNKVLEKIAKLRA